MAVWASRTRPSSHGPAAETADHRNFHRRDHGGAGDRTGIGEIEKTGARGFEKLCLFDKLCRRFAARLRLRRILRAIGNAVFGGRLRRQAELRENRDALADQRAHDLGKFGGGIDLDHVGAAVLDQPECGGARRVDALLHRAVRHVATHQRALDAAAHRLAADQHLVERDLEHLGAAPQIDADRIPDRHEIESGAVGDARELIIPGDDADALFAVALHLLQRGEWSPCRTCFLACRYGRDCFSTAARPEIRFPDAGAAPEARSRASCARMVGHCRTGTVKNAESEVAQLRASLSRRTVRDSPQSLLPNFRGCRLGLGWLFWLRRSGGSVGLEIGGRAGRQRGGRHRRPWDQPRLCRRALPSSLPSTSCVGGLGACALRSFAGLCSSGLAALCSPGLAATGLRFAFFGPARPQSAPRAWRSQPRCVSDRYRRRPASPAPGPVAGCSALGARNADKITENFGPVSALLPDAAHCRYRDRRRDRLPRWPGGGDAGRTFRR